MNYLTAQHTEVSSVAKINWTKKLNDFRDYDRQRVYYYRQKGLDNYGHEIIKGYYCVDCKGELTIFNNKGDDGYRYEPYRIHQVFIKKQEVNHPGTWNRGKKLEVSYFNALCCKCWEKQPANYECFSCERSDNTHEENCENKEAKHFNKCDCQAYLLAEIASRKKDIKETEKKLLTHQEVYEHLGQPVVFSGRTRIFLAEHLAEEIKKIAEIEEVLTEQKRDLGKLNHQLEQVKSLLGIEYN